MPDSSNLSRQSFLGSSLDAVLANARVAIIGLSGGGSHVVQQLAHIGFKNLYLFDPDCIEDTNLTRLVGATAADVAAALPKIEIARRLVLAVQPTARVHGFQHIWQDRAQDLKCVDLIFACVDSFLCRRDLEVLARRYRIPCIDIGMDVVQDQGGRRMYGQAVLSMPGGPCFFCQKLLTSQLLDQEGQRYGAVGPRPQVVWANGILASSAIGIAMDLLTGWSGSPGVCPFVSFDGNKGTLTQDPRYTYRPPVCPHFNEDGVGDPRTMRV